MRIRSISLGVVVLLVAVLTCVIGIFLTTCRCERIEWREAPKWVFAGGNDLKIFEAYCVVPKGSSVLQFRMAYGTRWMRPIEGSGRRLEKFPDRLRFKWKDSSRELRVSPAESLVDWGLGECGGHVYGMMSMTHDQTKGRPSHVFVYRVSQDSQLELCADISEVCLNHEVLMTTDNCKEENGQEWLEYSLKVQRGDEESRPGHLRIPSDQCVDASGLVSRSWRIRRYFQKLGIGKPPELKYLRAVPHLTKRDIVLDDLSPVFAPVSPKDSIRGNPGAG